MGKTKEVAQSSRTSLFLEGYQHRIGGTDIENPHLVFQKPVDARLSLLETIRMLPHGVDSFQYAQREMVVIDGVTRVSKQAKTKSQMIELEEVNDAFSDQRRP